MAATKKNTKTSSNKRRSLAPSAPEVKVGYATAGRETMAAIEAELAGPRQSAEAPVIEISEAPAGRETLAAIAEELSQTRPRQNTLPYGDRISNAPGAPAPAKPVVPASAVDDGPEVTVDERPETNERPAPPTPRQAPAQLEIFELLTFIVRGSGAGDLSTDAARRRFVETHLLHRVPTGSLDDVERIEVTPWTAKGTMVLRVWCRG